MSKAKAVVKLKKGEGRQLKSGGLWIYDNEIDTISGEYENGDFVYVHDFDDYYLAAVLLIIIPRLRFVLCPE